MHPEGRRCRFLGAGMCMVVALAGGCTEGPSDESATEASPAATQPAAAVAECGSGLDPDRPGPADQPRPDYEDWLPAAMDVHSGSVLAFDGSHTWAFDVCTNTWTRADPDVEMDVGDQIRTRLAYDSDDRVVVAVRHDLAAEPVVWAYSAARNTWRKQPPSMTEAPPDAWYLNDVAYDPVSGDVVTRDSRTGELWAYDVGQNAWEKWPRGDVSPAGYPDAHDLLAVDSRASHLVYVVLGGATWTYDLGAKSWTKRLIGSPSPNTGYFESGGEIAYDAAADRTVVFSDGSLAAYASTPNQWVPKRPGPGWPDTAYAWSSEAGMAEGPLARLGHSMVYDPVNQRIVLLGGHSRMPNGWQQLGDVWAYDVQTNTWIPLLAPRE